VSVSNTTFAVSGVEPLSARFLLEEESYVTGQFCRSSLSVLLSVQLSLLAGCLKIDSQPSTVECSSEVSPFPSAQRR
jgi:hypothetical protein